MLWTQQPAAEAAIPLSLAAGFLLSPPAGSKTKLIAAIQISNALNGMTLASIASDCFMEGSCVQGFCRHQCGTL